MPTSRSGAPTPRAFVARDEAEGCQAHQGWTQRPLLPNMSETGGGQPPRHRAPPCATRLTTGKASRTASARRSRPLRRASLASRPTPRVGHIHSSRCRTTGSPEGERRPGQRPGDAPAGCAGGEFSMMRTGSKARGPVSLDRRPRSRSRGPWWSKTGSNRRPHACKARALPTELLPREARWLGIGRRVSIGGPGKTRTSDLTLIKRAL